MNVFSATGNVCGSVKREARHNDRTEARFRFAVDRDFKNAEGKRDADFYTVICAGREAEYALNRVDKGTRLAVTGSLSCREMHGEDGVKRYENVIFANKLEVQP